MSDFDDYPFGIPPNEEDDGKLGFAVPPENKIKLISLLMVHSWNEMVLTHDIFLKTINPEKREQFILNPLTAVFAEKPEELVFETVPFEIFESIFDHSFRYIEEKDIFFIDLKDFVAFKESIYCETVNRYLLSLVDEGIAEMVVDGSGDMSIRVIEKKD